MPETLIKHPDKVKQILNEFDAAQCCKGLPQQILKKCPKKTCVLKEK